MYVLNKAKSRDSFDPILGEEIENDLAELVFDAYEDQGYNIYCFVHKDGNVVGYSCRQENIPENIETIFDGLDSVIRGEEIAVFGTYEFIEGGLKMWRERRQELEKKRD